LEKDIKKTISFLIPAYNEEQVLAHSTRTLHQYLLSKDISFEIIIHSPKRNIGLNSGKIRRILNNFLKIKTND